ALCLASEANAGAIYMMRGSNELEDYHELELAFENDKVSGEARPRRGYTTPPAIKVTGTNPADGLVELTFHLDKPRTLSFKKSIEYGEIRWTSEDERTRFWRPRTVEFSQADLTLTQSGCGPLYRELRVLYAEDTENEDFLDFARDYPEI